ncbi:peptidase M16 [Pseudomonas syringae]|uniref:Coenzyme PQQ synthesis protein F n=1 Tax=Pseudomonas syringae TaxID=317 RepID=A0A1C7ZEH1_PSESX|nr:pyrroloquinoline quinone biosynthesis protein PqqF [Pseudomonas syringae]OCR26765.1 peptidase M16 [Pseudomonas syringae]
MPASRLPAVEHLTLANGLRVVVCHAPRLKRAAASLRVAAGSHDVPTAWPGLAHFLEHLFFLGTERYPDDQKLMTFVQRNGGQLNASTRERTTDFFFELPLPAFGEGLDRLCEMLAHPRMTVEDQLREREVLHAEFIAWSRDAKAREQIRLLDPICATHPLKAFHAGNRFSLPVPRQAFQQALRDFYQRFYQAGQMTLCLTGPQSLEELKTLASIHGEYFVSGDAVRQIEPPRLMDRATFVQSVDKTGRSNLLFAWENLPDAADEAAAFLCHHLNSGHPDGLAAQLRTRGLAETLKAEVLYQFAGQLLIKVEMVLGHDSAIASKLVPTEGSHPAIALILDWFTFFKACWPKARDDYNRLQQRRLDTCGALDLAHHFARKAPQGLSERGGEALVALLGQLTAHSEFAVETVDWQLPEPNPFLTSQSDNSGAEGAIYLRWTLPAPQPALWQMLEQRLHALAEDAKQAGVNLAFLAYGNNWQLKLVGLNAPLPMILEQALRLLSHPDDAALARHGHLSQEPALIPIRQLLKSLPDHYLSSASGEIIQDVQVLWAATRWISFATGLSEQTELATNAALGLTPGRKDQSSRQAIALQPGKHWRSEASDSSESAVLLFCPASSLSVADEAAWRMLAHLASGPFYQHLRVELQLGYAVFSGFRQIDGQGGLLFGVQSPSASVQELVQHISDFIAQIPELIGSADLPQQQQTLAAQLDSAGMESASEAEMLWQAHLAGHGADYPNRLFTAVMDQQKTALLKAADQLEKASAGWLILSNSSSRTY